MLSLAKGLGAALQVLSSIVTGLMGWFNTQQIKAEVRKDEKLEQDARFAKADAEQAQNDVKVLKEIAAEKELDFEAKKKELADRFGSPSLQ